MGGQGRSDGELLAFSDDLFATPPAHSPAASRCWIIGEEGDKRTLEFVVRHPLVAGSEVSQCCVHRESNCLKGGRVEAGVVHSDCWFSGETEAAGCCDSDEGSVDDGGDDDDPGPTGDVGPPLDLPGPWTPTAPEYDDSDVVVDGGAESASGA